MKFSSFFFKPDRLTHLDKGNLQERFPELINRSCGIFLFQFIKMKKRSGGGGVRVGWWGDETITLKSDFFIRYRNLPSEEIFAPAEENSLPLDDSSRKSSKSAYFYRRFRNTVNSRHLKVEFQLNCWIQLFKANDVVT